MAWTLGDYYQLLYERALCCGYVVNIISVPQVEVGHWGIWFSMMSEDDVRPHSDASLRKDCKNFRLDLEGVWAALEWLDQWKVRRASYRETVIP